MSKIIDGKAMAEKLCDDLREDVAELQKAGIKPSIAVVLVGEDPASQVYVRNKVRRCEQLGIHSIEHRLDENLSEPDLLDLISQLNDDPSVHGVLVQLPLPKQINEKAVINTISPSKDVDGFHTENVGALSIGNNVLTPCTPLGSLMMLNSQLGDLSGMHAVVVGRSNIVGKPMSALLLNNNCTVTIVHSRTKNIESICRQADILIAAVGIPRLINSEWVKPGAVVIDVGINRIEEDGRSKLVGDVDFDDVLNVSKAITPVPGGVGPMTIACLMHNTVVAARQQNNLS